MSVKLKLVSRKDTLLGHVEVPDDIGEFLVTGQYATTPLPVAWQMPIRPASQDIVAPPLLRVTLARAGWSQYPSAVCLVEGTIEQLEGLPGYSFAPAMAYLRSHLEGKE